MLAARKGIGYNEWWVRLICPPRGNKLSCLNFDIDGKEHIEHAVARSNSLYNNV
jgi:hypothetical protein